MTHKIIKAFFLLVVITTSLTVSSQNLLSNGDFESGGAGVGFQTNYNLPAVAGFSNARDYNILFNPKVMNTAVFSNTPPPNGDHTTGSGKMMVVDGSGNGNDKVWELINGSSIGVVSGRTYIFSYWIRSISATNNATNSAIIAINTNGTTSTPVLVSGSATCPTGNPSAWVQVSYRWTATTNNAQIWITDTQTSNSSGNDFALDDLSLTEPPQPLSAVYSISNVTCPAATNGTIFGYGKGGTPPYNFSLSGPTVVPNNTNGFFTGLASGSYSLTITDNLGAPFTQNGIVVSTPPDLTIGASSTNICTGVSTTLTASGGGSIYNWSDNPPAATFTTAASQTVSPTQTTIYTVNSPVSRLDNLIYNGDFFLGNVGFTSDYTYYNPDNPTNAQKAYGVVNVANTWESGFVAATDHTNLTTPGTGKMMVVDGSTSNGGNDKVWCQTVPVVPGETYSLKYWIQSLVLVNPFPAKIEVKINNVSQGPAIIAPNAPSSWVQQSYTWTAGAGITTAQICFYDKEVQLNGNDFALDDISFARTNNCSLQKTVTITVTNTINLVVNPPTAVCAPNTVDITLPAVTAGSTAGITLTYWTDAAATLNQLSLASAAAIATSGTYYIKATLGTCSLIQPVTVTISASGTVPLPTAVSPIYICQGSTTSPLIATALPGATLNWYANSIGGPVLAGAPTPNAAVSGTTIYYVSQTIGTCEGPRKAISVIVNNTPGVINMFCDPNQVTTPTSIWFDWNNLLGPPVYNYTYSINGGPLVSGSWNISHFEVLNVLPGQSATLNITSINGYPCVAPTSLTCSNCSSTTTPTFTLPTSICSGSVAPTLPTTSINGITGTWSPATVSNTSSNSYVFNPDPVLFPCADQYTKSITVVNPPTAGTLNGNQSVCVGLTTTFSSSSTGGTWSSANPAIATVNASTGLVTGISSGTVSIDYTVAGTGGCSSVTNSRSVTVSNPGNAGILAGNQSICAGNITNLNSTVVGGTWSSSNNTIATINTNSGVVTGVSSGLATMTYTVTGLGGCPNATNSINITVTAIPNAGNLSGTQAICVGLSTTFASTVAGGIWSTSNPAIATVSATGNIIGVAAGVATISYIVNGTGGCPASVPATRNVTVSSPQSAGTLSGIQTICVGSSTTFIPTVLGGRWESSNPTIASVNATTGIITGNATGTATIRYIITGTGGCSDTDVTRTITVNSNIVPTFNAVAPICSGNSLTPLPSISTNGITGTWNPPLDNTTTTEYTFTPTPGLCATITRLTITVDPRIIPFFGLFAPLCQGSTPPVLPTTSDNIPTITGTWNPPTVNTASLGTTIYTFNPTAGQCVSNTLTTLTITVVPVLTPNFQPIVPFCDGTSAPTLSNTSPNGVEGTWSPAIISNSLSGNYLFTPNPDQCAVTQTLSVTIIPRTVPDFAVIPPFCKGTPAPILDLTSPNGITGTWSPATVDNTVGGIFPYVFTPDATECATQYTLYADVIEPANPGFPDLAFCYQNSTPPLPALSPNGISGTWLPATIDNEFSAAYEFTPDIGECALTQTINVTINQYTLIAIDGLVTNYFEENQVITVLATDSGNYLYQLDYGPLQQSNVFQNVSAGTHVIKVVDANGCSSPLTRDVLVVNYPKFFTPNDDTYNDTWNISGLQEQKDAKIFIFDRYGKLIKQIYPSGQGWDGTYNGALLPSDDYWFLVEFTENFQSKEFKAHFSLKR